MTTVTAVLPLLRLFYRFRLTFERETRPLLREIGPFLSHDGGEGENEGKTPHGKIYGIDTLTNRARSRLLWVG